MKLGTIVSGSVLLGVVVLVITYFSSIPPASEFELPIAGSPILSAVALERAEKFVYLNGYTDAAESEIKQHLDPESIEWYGRRGDILDSRRNTLRPDAIGIKSTDSGWGVAFDYVEQYPTKVRVVTMDANGGNVRVQHQDGVRDFWVGSDQE